MTPLYIKCTECGYKDKRPNMMTDIYNCPQCGSIELLTEGKDGEPPEWYPDDNPAE